MGAKGIQSGLNITCKNSIKDPAMSVFDYIQIHDLTVGLFDLDHHE